MASFSTMEIHVDPIRAIKWMRRYDPSRYVYIFRVRFDSHLMLMAAIMWSILSRKNLQKHGWGVSFKIQSFTNSSNVHCKEQSWVTCIFVKLSPFLFKENLCATHGKTTPVLLIWRTKSMVRGRAQP